MRGSRKAPPPFTPSAPAVVMMEKENPGHFISKYSYFLLNMDEVEAEAERRRLVVLPAQLEEKSLLEQHDASLVPLKMIKDKFQRHSIVLSKLIKLLESGYSREECVEKAPAVLTECQELFAASVTDWLKARITDKKMLAEETREYLEQKLPSEWTSWDPVFKDDSESISRALERLSERRDVVDEHFDAVHMQHVASGMEFATNEERFMENQRQREMQLRSQRDSQEKSFCGRCKEGDWKGALKILEGVGKWKRATFVASQKTSSGLGAIHLAAHFGHVEVVQELLRIEPALALLEDDLGYTPLHHALTRRFERNTRVLRAFVDADPASLQPVTDNPLLPFASQCENVPAIIFLLEQPSANVNIVDRGGFSALHWACQFGNIGIIRLLVANKADISLVNRRGQPPLACAHDGKQELAIRVMIQLGAPPLSFPQVQDLLALFKNDEEARRLLALPYKLILEQFKEGGKLRKSTDTRMPLPETIPQDQTN